MNRVSRYAPSKPMMIKTSVPQNMGTASISLQMALSNGAPKGRGSLHVQFAMHEAAVESVLDLDPVGILEAILRA